MDIAINKMTTAEKIRTMEELWDDLCRHAAQVQSPSWHQDVISAREEALSKGGETVVDWDTAKKGSVKRQKIRILESALQDLIDGFYFYEKQEAGLGGYFMDSLFSDIDSLQL